MKFAAHFISGHTFCVFVGGESSWGVNSLITLIDSTIAAEFNQDERDKIENGDILVNCDPATGRTIIRVWPKCAAQRHRSTSLLDISEGSSNSSGDFRYTAAILTLT